MYRSVNLSEDTYQKLQRLSTQFNKPKAQVLKSLVKRYDETMKKKEKEKLEKFNKEMGARVKALRFSKKIKVDTSSIDEDFSALADTGYKV